MTEEKKKIDYMGILRSAWDTAWNNKFLWWFGVLVSLGGGGQISINNLNFFSGEDSDEEIPPETIDSIKYYWSLYMEWIILGAIVLVILVFAFYLLGILGRGALIKSIFLLKNNEKMSFTSGLKEGKKVFWKILGLNMLIFAVLIIVYLIMIFPVLRLYFLGENGSAMALGLIAIPIIISISILAAFLKIYSQIYLAAEELKIIESIKLSYVLLKNNLKESLIMGIVMIVVNIVAGIFMVAGMLILIIPLIAIGATAFFLLKLSEMVAISMGVVALIILIFSIIIFNAGYASFIYAAWIEFFGAIGKGRTPEEKEENLQKESEEKEIPEPEGLYFDK